MNIDISNVAYLCFQERKERLKKEGKFLTKTQKQQRAHAQAMLDSMKKQGTNCVGARNFLLKLTLRFCVNCRWKHHILSGLEIIPRYSVDTMTSQIHLSAEMCYFEP